MELNTVDIKTACVLQSKQNINWSRSSKVVTSSSDKPIYNKTAIAEKYQCWTTHYNFWGLLRRDLHIIDIWSIFPRKSPKLTCTHKKACLQWAKFHKTWTVEDWKWVTKCNKYRFCLYSNNARHRVHYRKNEAFPEDCVQGVVKEQGGSVMFWGCFIYFELGPLVFELSP